MSKGARDESRAVADHSRPHWYGRNGGYRGAERYEIYRMSQMAKRADNLA